MFCKRNLLFLLTAVILVAGCSDQNGPASPETTGQRLSGLVRGEISNDLIDFEFAAKVGNEIDDPEPGTLLVRGRNLAYDSDLGVLTVDFSVYNDAEVAYPELVGMTFLQFIPSDLTILDSDNDEDGAGALIMFEFEDDNGEWSPGEESLGRNVSFVVAAGTSIGFVARVDVGLMPAGGTIGGMVWHDDNEDGEIDPDEEGVGGITMALHADNDTTITPLGTAVTAEDGTYHFESLDPGFYTVVRMAHDDYEGTTPSEMAVLLVEMDGTVSSFLLAHFGVSSSDGLDDFVRVGDYVDAKGEYQAEPNRLVADKFKVERCDDDGNKHDDDDGDDDGDDDDDDGCRQNDCWGRLSGPLTAVNLEDSYFEVMGTKVHFSAKDRGHDDEWESGFRVRVDATRDADVAEGEVVACKRPKWHNGHDDQVRGFVQEIVRGDDDRITGVIVLNTLIEVPEDAEESD
ncbi:MAG: SdrD B-like domain-containing protein [Candidatus Krumholzibacteria bacterium]|nr:SdrD B-like domain-containing protein [Candidatus Krumholzibacteria bacterium]